MAFIHSFTSQFLQGAGLDLKLVSRISLFTGIGAAILLVSSVLFLTDQNGTSYAEIIYAHSLTQKHLKPVLLISSLCLLSFVAFVTWLITLYSSFKIAGPLYRFSRNLEQAGIGVKPIGVRKDDALQDVSALLQESIATLHRHYDGLDEKFSQALELLDSDKAGADEELASVIAELKTLVKQVKFDE